MGIADFMGDAEEGLPYKPQARRSQSCPPVAGADFADPVVVVVGKSAEESAAASMDHIRPPVKPSLLPGRSGAQPHLPLRALKVHRSDAADRQPRADTVGSAAAKGQRWHRPPLHGEDCGTGTAE